MSIVVSTNPMSPPRTEPNDDPVDERVAKLYGSFSPHARATPLMLPTLPVVSATSMDKPIVVVVVPML